MEARFPTLPSICKLAKYWLDLHSTEGSRSMPDVTQFSDEVAQKLRHYVYRLIDPRNGMTFYVGRGTGNRAFPHAAGKAAPSDDQDSLKLRTIWAVHAVALRVQHVIHRHGMDEQVAREVEAALIDAYPSLTNIQGGYASDR